MKQNEIKYQIERKSAILAFAAKHGRVSVEELSARFRVSSVTIRKDLRSLDAQGRLIRTHGGAIYRDTKTGLGLFDTRNATMLEEKKRIGERAASLVQPGEVIYLDASVTVMEMIPFILNIENLSVITNSLEVASNLSILSDHPVVMLGGTIYKESFATIWNYPELISPDINISTAFFGALGFSTKTGLTDRDINVIHQKRYILSKSHRIIALVDSSKWARVSFGTFANPEQLSLLISDTGAPVEEVAELRRVGLKVMLV